MIRRMAGTPTRSTVYDLIKYRATLHAPRRAEQPSHCRRRCQHQSVTFTYCDYRHGSQLKELTPLRPGVHPALQLAYPASGTGAYPTLWNPRQQSQKSCYRSSPRDLQAPPARRGASAIRERVEKSFYYYGSLLLAAAYFPPSPGCED